MANTSLLNSEYEFKMKSNPPMIDFNDTPLRNFEKVSLSSSMDTFYSYAEINFKDEMGIIIDKAFFTEGLEFYIKYGNEDYGFLENTFCWSENQVLNAEISGRLSGTNVFIMLDNAYIKDLPRSKSYTNSISGIVREVALTELGISSDKIFISETDDSDTWYRYNEDAKSFIKRLSDIAYSKNSNKSPFVTFINTNGEFYFMAISELFSSQQPVETYIFSIEENAVMSKDVITDFNIMMGGLPINYDDYKKKVFSMGADASISNEIFDIKDHFYKEAKEKILVRKDYQDITDYIYLGLAESANDKKLVKGQVNSLYRDSALSYRMEIVIHFNPKCVTGKLINIKVDSAFEDKQIAGEYSGKWVIIEDDFLVDEEEHPYQRLMLSKSAIKIDTDHPFNKDFIS